MWLKCIILHVTDVKAITLRLTVVSPYLGVAANWRWAALTAVSEQVLIALSAVLSVLFHYVLLPQQGVFAVMAVETLAGGHCCLLVLAASQREQEEENWTIRKTRKDGKCPVIVQAIFSSPLGKQVKSPSNFFPPFLSKECEKKTMLY